MSIPRSARVPHWIATADLSFVSGTRPREGTVVAEGRVARAGSKLVVADVDLGPAGRATATFVRIPREASRVSDRPPTEIGQRMQMERTGPRLAVPITERMGIRTFEGGGDTSVLRLQRPVPSGAQVAVTIERKPGSVAPSGPMVLRAKPI